MGLIQAITGAIGGTLADQWKEYFICDSLENDVLMVKGKKRISSRSSNRYGNDNIISAGSGIVVADGQCMIIVEQGQIVEFCAEPGQFTWDSSTEPSLFTGSLGEGLLETFRTIGKRFTYGGDTGKDQRVYYFNTKEILGNKFGTPNPIPFRVVDSRIGFDVDVSLRCNGTYSFRLTDPLQFYKNIAGNVRDEFTKDEILPTMKAEFISALGPAIGRLSELELRPNQIPSHMPELEKLLNEALATEWGSRGIGDIHVAMGAPTLPEEDQEMLKTAQKTAMYRDPTMAAATLVDAQAEAMKTAAGNQAGAMTGFMGMNMAAGSGANAQTLFAMGQQNQAQPTPAPAAKPADTAGEWTCSCGHKNTGKFCMECGAKKPDDGWTCTCGSVNKGKFCPECGAKKPAGVPQYKCDKCGWEPEDPTKPPKFCPECGDPFDDGDIRG